MQSLNEIRLIGNLGHAPSLSEVGDTKKAKFSLATNRKWTDKRSGEMREDTQWHNIILWGRQAEVAEKYLSKGDPVYIAGRTESRKYTTKDGTDKWITEVIGFQLILLGGRKESAQEAESAQQPAMQPTGGGGDDLPF